MRTWQSLGALAVLAAIAILTWVAVLVVMAVPAFPAQLQPSAYDVCLLRIAHDGGYYTSLEGGNSALDSDAPAGATSHAPSGLSNALLATPAAIAIAS
jgi:hypothetical protein